MPYFSWNQRNFYDQNMFPPRSRYNGNFYQQPFHQNKYQKWQGDPYYDRNYYQAQNEIQYNQFPFYNFNPQYVSNIDYSFEHNAH